MQHIIELVRINSIPNSVDIILVGKSTDDLFINACQTIRKICSRYKFNINHSFTLDESIIQYINSGLINEVYLSSDDIPPPDLTTPLDINKPPDIILSSQQALIDHMNVKIDDIYCEFFGEINRGGKLDEETTGINKKNEKEFYSNRPELGHQEKKEESGNPAGKIENDQQYTGHDESTEGFV